MASSLQSIIFNGRWDLRSPDRAVTINSGSQLHVRFSGTSITGLFDTAMNQVPFPTIAWKIDDGDWKEAEVAETVSLADNLSSGPHTLWLAARGLDEHQNRWTKPQVASITFLGVKVPDGKVLPPLADWTRPRLKIEFLGDSITEGVLVQPKGVDGKTTWAWKSDAVHSYSWLTALALDAEWRQVGFGATGVSHGGSGNTPPALETFNFFYADCPRDNWEPDLVLINQGSNDNGTPIERYLPGYIKYLQLIRQAYPHAKIVAMRPFGGAQEKSIPQAIDAMHQAGDKNVFFLDTTGWYMGPGHPPATLAPDLSVKLVEALKSQVLEAKPTP